jgi:phytoene desaturase
VTDPTLAPPGRGIRYVLAPVPHLRAGDAAVDWHRVGPRYRDHVLSTLAARGHDVVGRIDVEHVTTPLDWQARGMEAGTPFAAAHSFGQTGPFRPRNLPGRVVGENVVLTGSGTQPGVGVPMVLVSGRLAAERVVGRHALARSTW